MANPARPSLDLAKRVLPAGLLEALLFIAGRCGPYTMLVGGTALAGFYAGHRRSDDLDLFCQSESAFEATVRAATLLGEHGAQLNAPFRSGTYYRATVTYLKHSFTVDVVLDPNLFRVGERLEVGSSLGIASLKTLLKMKSAALVSRCSEKDLYDLLWLFEYFRNPGLDEFISAGGEIDGGVNGEAMIFSLASAKLSESACGFVFSDREDPVQVFKRISLLRQELIEGISSLLHKKPTESPLGELVSFAQKIERGAARKKKKGR